MLGDICSYIHLGSHIVHRCPVAVDNCVEMAAHIVVMLSTKKETSPDRISRSSGAMWPLNCAVTSSITEWSSGGRDSGMLFDGRSESVERSMFEV